ncbi:MAG TPA: DUF4328 domain-containing protein [Methylomirabilota bacterium]|nr:DUF4328 domain-containing protein [Methylomirabilota bacterium]
MLPRAHPHPFPATRRLTLLVAALLALHVVLAWFALQAAFVFVELVWRIVAGRDELRALLATHLAQFRVLRLVQAGLWLVTAAAFVRWVGRAQGNLPALGATGFRYAPRQAMAAFLVPGPNVVRPPAVLRELWNASDPRYPAGTTWRAGRAPACVRWWWALLLAAAAAEVAARALALWSGDPLDLGPAMRVLVLGQLLAAAAAVLGITVVLGVDSRQEAAAWRRAGAPARSPDRRR